MKTGIQTLLKYVYTISFCIYTLTLSSQNIVLDTIHSTFDLISEPKFSGNNHFAWYEEDYSSGEVVFYHKFNNQLEELVIDPIFDNCLYRGRIAVTADKVAWGIGDTNEPNCQHTLFVWTDGIGITQDQFGFHRIISENRGVITASFPPDFRVTQIVDLNAEATESIPSFQMGGFKYTYSNIAAIAGDIIWIKGFKRDIVTDVFIGQVILRYDRTTGGFQEIYLGSDFLAFRQTDNPNQLAFTEGQSDGSYDIKFYNGSSVNFVANSRSASVYTFNNGAVYELNSADDEIFHWSSGTVTQLNSDAASMLIQSSCYYSYISYDYDTTTLYITDGTNTVDITVNGNIDGGSFRLIGNEFIYVVEDFYGLYHLVYGQHNLSCDCPDDQVFVTQADPSDYTSRKSIESEATIPSPFHTNYEATDYILLHEDFEVELGATFTANIFGCHF